MFGWLQWWSYSKRCCLKKPLLLHTDDYHVSSSAVLPIIAMHHGAQKTDFRALYRANAVLDRIVRFWSPLIEEALKNGDPLACTFLNVFVPFVRVVLNADVLRTWLIRRKAEAAATGQEPDVENARLSLTSEESHCLGFAVSAAENMLYYLSTASKREGQGQRSHDWAPRDTNTGHRPPLQLDPDVARKLSSATDNILLVVFAFPPLFLAQMRSNNIINCDLDMAPEITNDLFTVGFPSRSLLPASKFMRLLELSAEFYEVTSPNSDFPAIPQAQLLRTMACLSIPSNIPSSLPNFSNGELSFLDGSSCNILPGQLNSPSCVFDSSAQAKAHQYHMQQVAANASPTNANLPFPYNTMVYASDGADSLEKIMASALPDPAAAQSLLGSFAKIDQDWNSYFMQPTQAGGQQQYVSSGIPMNGNTSSPVFSNMHQQQQPPRQQNAKLVGSPDSSAHLLAGNSPANYHSNGVAHNLNYQR